jgi:hypothetical protein
MPPGKRTKDPRRRCCIDTSLLFNMLVDLMSTCRLVVASAASAVVSTSSILSLVLMNREHLCSYDLLRESELKHYLCPQAQDTQFYNTTNCSSVDDDDGDSELSTNCSTAAGIDSICSADTMTPISSTYCCYDVGDWSMWFTVLTAVLFLAVIHNIIAFYNFVAAWNLILEARRVDLAQAYICRQRRRTVQDVIATHVHVDKMNEHTSCPICLEDFYEQDLVTNCDEGCGNYFHKECLFNWLEYNNTCACCRKDLIVPKSKGWISSFCSFVVGIPC